MPVRRTVRAAADGDIGRNAAAPDRKRRGDYPTPPALVERVVGYVVGDVVGRAAPGATITVLDPACGDGRFLVAAARRIVAAGCRAELHGVELDPDNAAAAEGALGQLATPTAPIVFRVDTGDALARRWDDGPYDAVIGNPPYLSQLATATARGGSSRRGGGPYADVAAEFLHLAVHLAHPGGGCVGLVLPQSILASRDVGPIRRAVECEAERTWSWWSPAKHFDAAVLVCALGFRRRPAPLVAPSGAGNLSARTSDRDPVWTDVIVSALEVPDVPAIRVDGSLGDRARFSADFRDCYYGLVPAAGDEVDGPRLMTSGLIDPLRSRWGERPVRFGGRVFAAPRIAVGELGPRWRAWAEAMGGSKVLVANQAPVVECLVDDTGSMLPGVPIVTARPSTDASGPADSGGEWARRIAAVLTSPVAAVWVWHHAAGTGLSARSVRIGPRLLASVPWPAGSLDEAVAAVEAGDARTCGRLVDAAFGVDEATDAGLHTWWASRLPPDA